MATIQIPVKYIDTSKYIVTAEYDGDTDSPADWGNFTIVTFGRNNLITDTDRDEYFTDNDKLRPGMVTRLRFGTAFPIKLRNYSSAGDWFYDLADSADDCDGLILFEHEYIKGTDFEERKRYATGDLATYQQWANGDVYWVRVENARGDEIDSLGGLYGSDGIKDFLAETIDGYQEENLTVKGEAAYAL